MITVSTLFSGSDGNSTLIRTENTAILIDAGKSCRAIRVSLESLGMELGDISAIFVTHEHKDHISALDVISRKTKMPIHISEPSSRDFFRKYEYTPNYIIHMGVNYKVKVGDMLLRTFPLPHDSAANVGYVVESDDGDRAALATDMGFAVKTAFENMAGCRQIVIEANHDIEMLKTGLYPRGLKRRILSKMGHLSNEAAAEMCVGLAEKGCRKFMLAHLSDENNTPEMAQSTVRNRLDEEGYTEVEVKTAPRCYALTL